MIRFLSRFAAAGLSGACAAHAASDGLSARIALQPVPQSVVYQGDSVAFPKAIVVQGCDDPGAWGTLLTLPDVLPGVEVLREAYTASYLIRFAHSDAVTAPEGYHLESTRGGIAVTYSTAAGEFYAAQTIYQLLAYSWHGGDFTRLGSTPADNQQAREHPIPLLTIDDHPAYAVRSVMLDLGRAPFTVPLIERTIRIMGQLKLNTLHLHLYDDQLCGFRFAHLPLGHENPHAIDAAQLREIVRYAAVRHVAVMPELESWGHVASLTYHYPELRGGSGMYGGASFAVGSKSYALLGQIYDEIIPCLADEAAVHVGLDEAGWYPQADEKPLGDTPTKMVGRIYDLLMQVAERHHKHVTMHLWADHGGRALPTAIADKVVIEPWKYLGVDGPDIAKALVQYGGEGKTPVMMGGGDSSASVHGAYLATRDWCTLGLQYPNIRGVTLCIWESNDLSGRLSTIYVGAGCAWSPQRVRTFTKDPYAERLDNFEEQNQRSWQALFPDAAPPAIDADRGPEAASGRYLWPPHAGEPVAPTMAALR